MTFLYWGAEPNVRIDDLFPPDPVPGPVEDGPGCVLVIDDNEGVRALFEGWLEAGGFEVMSASGGAEGLRLLRANPRIRLVLLDLMMPEMDGWRFRHEQMIDPKLAKVATVIVSGAPIADMAHEQLQAAGYLRKPILRKDFLDVVSTYCEPAQPRP